MSQAKKGITPRKKPVQARARATWDAIVEAAAQVFNELGGDATTNQIADRAGVSIGSLYQYFPNKEALLVAVVEGHVERMREMLERLQSQLGQLELEQAVPLFVKMLLQIHAEQPQLHRMIGVELPRIVGVEGIQRFNAPTETLIEAYLGQHVDRLRPKNLKMATFMIVTAVEAVVHFRLVVDPNAHRDPEFAHELSQLVLGYLQKPTG